MVKRTRSKSRRKSRTRGWAKAAPKRTTVRRAQLKRCGAKCYLSPKKLKFPVCPKGSCKVSCKGAQSAYIRARQWKHSKVAKKAARILKKRCGHTVGPKRRSKSRRRSKVKR